MPDLTTATDEARAKRRMEIEAKLSDLRLQQAKETEQKAAFFGEHAGITCDGCGAVNIVGFRYQCTVCPNFDLCESCEGRGIHDVTHTRLKIALPKPAAAPVAEVGFGMLHATSGRRGSFGFGESFGGGAPSAPGSSAPSFSFGSGTGSGTAAGSGHGGGLGASFGSFGSTTLQ